MSNIVDYLRSKKELIIGQPAGQEEIEKTEALLGVRFSDEYKSILHNFGFVCVDGHEITGLTKAKRLNVYDITLKERENFKDVSELYVIEQTHIDGIVVWQATSGEVYQTGQDGEWDKIADNIEKYLS